MDEKMQDILNQVQKTAAVIGDTAADAAYGVSIKAKELLSVGKMNIRLAELKASVQTELRRVGEMIYATHTGNPTESEELLAKLQGMAVEDVLIEEPSLEEIFMHYYAVDCGPRNTGTVTDDKEV